jgi:hypothetical protein
LADFDMSCDRRQWFLRPVVIGPNACGTGSTYVPGLCIFVGQVNKPAAD